MKEIDTLKAQMDDLVDANTELNVNIDEANSKTDLLIAASAVVLTRLKELKDAANHGGNVTAADIQPMIDKMTVVLEQSKAGVASLNAQDAETDAATAAAAAAGGPDPDPLPPQDDAFVAVGGTRFSDGLVQTEETLAAAIIVWNDAHPEGPVAG